MVVTNKNVALLEEKRVLNIYSILDDLLKKRAPTVQEIYEVILKGNEKRGLMSVSCEAETKIFISDVLERHRLDVYAVFMRPVSEMDKEILEKMIRIMYEKKSFSQLKIAKYLDIPPDRAYNIIRRKIIAPKDKAKHTKLLQKRDEEKMAEILKPIVRSKNSSKAKLAAR
ncbi:MAG: hypothetical protein KGH71_04990 [Candidatus Micrarchaeota archaeon]|nr:hypothetical protein [Candidatus Micrarchaeota archaeon]